MSMIEDVAIAIFASDGMKITTLSIEESWAQSSEMHIDYRERALVFLKVYGERMAKLADSEIAKIGISRRPAPAA